VWPGGLQALLGPPAGSDPDALDTRDNRDGALARTRARAAITAPRASHSRGSANLTRVESACHRTAVWRSGENDLLGARPSWHRVRARPPHRRIAARAGRSNGEPASSRGAARRHGRRSRRPNMSRTADIDSSPIRYRDRYLWPRCHTTVTVVSLPPGQRERGYRSSGPEAGSVLARGSRCWMLSAMRHGAHALPPCDEGRSTTSSCGARGPPSMLTKAQGRPRGRPCADLTRSNQ
jgi:hypothetical protein